MTQREQYKPAEHGTAIPAAITEITIKRSDYNDSVFVSMRAALWTASFNTPEEHLYQRIHEIAAEMERTP